MATTVGNEARARDRARRASRAALTVLGEAAAWFGIAAAGLVVVFVGLGVDAWRHNHGAQEESLLSPGNPGHLIAFIGLSCTSIAVLAGFSISALKNVATVPDAVRRFAPITAAWVVVAATAIGSLTYIAATGVTVGHSHGAATQAAADTHTHNDAAANEALGDAGVAQALRQQGIEAGGGGTDPASVPGALTQGASGVAGAAHDHGKQPTFAQIESLSDAQLLPLFPPNTVTAADLPTLKKQIEAVAEVARKYPTADAAKAAGYVRTTSDVPYMGEHWLNYDLVKSGVFDPSHPQGLLFSKVDDGPEKLVGVWFLLLPGINGIKRDVQPVGFASDLDLWHAHLGLCLVGLSGASEGETRESCQAKGGSFTADLRWMMHVWVAPGFDNPDGVFAYLNADLFQKQQAAAKAANTRTGDIGP
jgi:hypothetical protein